jgi:hypothetical protein
MNTYEMQREIEAKERQELIVRLEKIAEALGFEVKKPDEPPYYACVHAVKGNMELYLNSGSYCLNGKIEASISHVSRRNITVYKENQRIGRPSICMSVSKSDDQIIKDIKRRLIADGEEYVKLYQKQIDADDAYKNQTLVNLATIKGKPLDDRERESKSIWIEGTTIKCYGDSVSMNLISIPVDQAVKIVRILEAK